MTQITAHQLLQEPFRRPQGRPRRSPRFDAAGTRVDPYLWLLALLSLIAFGCGASAFA